jgi:tetratricopeptide (TPR) repeat protein
VLDGLTALVDSNLVRVRDPSPVLSDAAADPPRLTLLETIREYGAEQLQTHAEHDATRQRHAVYFLAVAENALEELSGRDAPAAMARLDAEHDNLRAALRWVHERADAQTAVRLAGCLWPFWLQRGHLSEGRRWLQQALDLPADDTVSPSERLTALIGAARLAIDQADHDHASTASTDAVALARQEADTRQLVAALNVRGYLARGLDRYAESFRDHDEARALAHAAHDKSGEADALLGLAYAAMFTGDVTGARDLADDSLAIARDLADDRLVAQALSLLAWQATNVGAYDRAAAVGTEALVHMRRLGDTGETAEMCFVLGNIALFQGDYERADRAFQEALSLHRDRGDALHLSRDLGGVGAAALNLGDLTRARTLSEESLVLAQRYHDRWGTAMSLTVVGHVELAAGDHGRALALFTEAADLFQAIGNLLYLPWCLEGLAGVAAGRGEHEHAAELDGAREAVQTQTGVVVPPLHRTGYTDTLATVRAALTPDAFHAARLNGRARPPTHVIVNASR